MTDELSEAIEKARVDLAVYAHEAWCGWMRYLVIKCQGVMGGGLHIPHWAVERWRHQGDTRYPALSKEEQEYDLKEADKMLAIVKQHLAPLLAAKDAEIVELDQLRILRVRNAIADKEWITAAANHDVAKFGSWQCDWSEGIRDANRELHALQQGVEEASHDIEA